jgi:D-glycero-alpha-D-manno-heptose 1-phosphate guanylyltransferase
MSFQPSRITGFVLAGGLGTRLRPALENLPKVLAPVNGRPFLTLLLDQLIDAGVDQIVLCTGYLADHIRDTIGNHYREAEIFYSAEDEPLGTAGALRLAAGRFPAETILAMNGDSFLATQLGAFIEWYRTEAWQSGLILTWVEDVARFGAIDVSDGGEIKAFREKQGIVEPGWINAGIYLLPLSRMLSLPEGQALSLERSVFPEWGRANTDQIRVLGGFCIRAPFIDIGTPASLAAAAPFMERFGGSRFTSDL